jgi:hypothetical protein
MLKTGCTWVILRGYGGPLGSTVNPPQTEPDKWVGLLESRVWICGTCGHAISKHIT